MSISSYVAVPSLPAEQIEERSRLREMLSVAGITAVGLALRLVAIDARSFWLDETTSVRQAGWSIPEMLAWQAHNVHPPLFHALLHFWMLAFGRAEITVRSFSLLWGVLAIPLMYWVASSVYDRRVGMYATWIVALAPFYVWYAQEARMYTMMLLFALLNVGALWRALNGGGARWWALYAVASAAGLMTMYFFGFLLAGEAVYVLFAHRPDRKRTILLWLLASAVAMLPYVWWVPKVLAHAELLRGVTGAFDYGGTPPSLGLHFNKLLLVPVQWLFGFHSETVTGGMVAMWPLLITLLFATSRLARRFSSRTRFLLWSGGFGAGLVALLGMWQPIVLEVRYFTAVSVPLVMLGARLLADLSGPRLTTAVAVLLVIGAATWLDQSYNPVSVVKWDNRAAMGIVKDGYQGGDAVLLIPHFVTSIPEYYLPPNVYREIRVIPSFDANSQPRNSPAKLAEDLDRKVGPSTRVWLIATWQELPRVALDRRLTQRWLESEGFQLKQDHKLHRIRVQLFETARPRGIFVDPAVTSP